MNPKICVIVAALALSGCATIGNVPTVADNHTVVQIQAAVKKICSFVPTVSTVAAIVTTFTGGSATVGIIEQVANAICGAVGNKALRKGAAAPRVNGVAIKGHFVNH